MNVVFERTTETCVAAGYDPAAAELLRVESDRAHDQRAAERF